MGFLKQRGFHLLTAALCCGQALAVTIQCNGGYINSDISAFQNDIATVSNIATPLDCQQACAEAADCACAVHSTIHSKCYLKGAACLDTDLVPKEGFTSVFAACAQGNSQEPASNPASDPVANNAVSTPTPSGDCIYKDTDFVKANAATFVEVNSAAQCQEMLRSSATPVNVGVFSAKFKKCWAKFAANEASDGKFEELEDFDTIVAGSQTLCSRLAAFQSGPGAPVAVPEPAPAPVKEPAPAPQPVPNTPAVAAPGDCIFQNMDFVKANAATFVEVNSAAQCQEMLRSSATPINVGVFSAKFKKCWAKFAANEASDGKFEDLEDFDTIVAGSSGLCQRAAALRGSVPAPAPAAAPAPAPVMADSAKCIFEKTHFLWDNTKVFSNINSAKECQDLLIADPEVNLATYSAKFKKCWAKTVDAKEGAMEQHDEYMAVVAGSTELCNRIADFNKPSTSGSSDGGCMADDTDFALANKATFTNVNSAADCQKKLEQSNGGLNVGVWNADFKKCWAKFAGNEAKDGTVKDLDNFVTVVHGSATLCGRLANREPAAPAPEQPKCPPNTKQLPFARANKVLTAPGTGQQVELNYKPGNKLCGGGSTKVIMQIWKGCDLCAGAKCKVWAPSTDGFYEDNCSLSATADGKGEITFMSHVPGDESKVGWGADPNPHWHFSCTGCGGKFINKFYLETPTQALERIKFPDATNVATNGFAIVKMK